MLRPLRRYAVWAFGSNPITGRGEWWLASRRTTARAAARRAAYLNHAADEGYLYVHGSVNAPPNLNGNASP